MRFATLFALLALLVAGHTLHAAAVDPTSPEGTMLVPVQALRNNDLEALFKGLPPEQQEQARKQWAESATKADPQGDAQFDQMLAMALAPGAVDALMPQIEATLKQYNPQQASMGLMMVGGMAAMGLAKDPANAPFAQVVQTLVQDIAAWLPTAGIEDPARAKKAMTSAFAGIAALGVKSAAEMRALKIEEFLHRLGPALKEFKAAFAAYDLDVDKLLDSVKVEKVEGEGDKRTAVLKLTAFTHEHSLPIKLVKSADGRWVPDTAGLKNSVQGLMQGGPGGPGGAEAPAGGGPAAK